MSSDFSVRSTRERVESLTLGSKLVTRDTVVVETPALLATSSSFIRPPSSWSGFQEKCKRNR
jgi:hypothetical protein